ncbi:MAG: ferrochelatase [Puniceicoccales bacterium]|jgi:ferrochelatase|nr:ferrochelatase [Puniceicoccales bacterium]
MSKRGVLLLNLGSPKSCAVGDVRDYLREFLGDERVIDGNPFLRWFLLHCIILRRRPPRTAEAYKKVWTAQGAPLLAATEALRTALAASVPSGVSVYVGMRYSEPSTRAAVAAAVRDGVTDLLVLPQYPHFAMSSYETAVVRVQEELRRQAPEMRVKILEPFYNATGYIGALVESAAPYLAQPFDKLLFSYHGVPLRHLRREIPDYPDCHEPVDCCPPVPSLRSRDYRHQCFATLEAFAKAAQVPREKCAISFQSRLGRAAWIHPYTDETLRALPAQGVKKLLVLCPAFTADCLETLEEIRVEGRQTFLDAGGESFQQIPCLNDHPAYVKFLSDEVSAWLGAVELLRTKQFSA